MQITGFFATWAAWPYLVATPIVVLILGLLVRQPWKKAVQGGIKVGMGALGMVALSYFAITYFAPAVLGAARTLGGPMNRMTLIDVGWTNAAMVLANPMIWVNILIFIAINIGLIWIGATKTLYVDFPCMWRGVWMGMIVWATIDNFIVGSIAMQIFLISDVLIADWNARRLQSFHEFSSSASFPNSQNAAIIGAPLAWLLARISGKSQEIEQPAAGGTQLFAGVPLPRAWKIDGEWVQKNLGFFAEPMVLGVITGTVLGLLAGFNVLNALGVGIVAAMMFHLWPMALGVCFDGWSVFNEGMRNILVKWMKGKRQVYVAVDTSVLLGHPTVGISTTLMYPIAFLLSVFVPGIGLFPVISVQIIQWWMAHITGWTRGNILHNLIICSVLVVLYGWTATALAEPYTFWAVQYGLIPQELIDQGIRVTNWDGGGDLRIFLIYKLFSLFR